MIPTASSRELSYSTTKTASFDTMVTDTPGISFNNDLETVAILVLNWNGKNDTLECLSTLVCQTYPRSEIIVIDNGSMDGSAEAIREAYPQVTLIETGENLGYAGGNNVGIRYAIDKGFSYFLILNNDTLCPKNLIDKLVGIADTRSDIAFVGPVIYLSQDTNKNWSAGAHWNSSSQQLELIKVIGPTSQGADVIKVESVVGCALFGRTSIINQIGMFDERFFLMHEESDLCFRAKAAGYQCYIAIGVGIAHKVSVSFGGNGSPLMSYFDERNSLLWGSRHLSRRSFFSLLISRIGRLVKLLFNEIQPLRFGGPRNLYWQILETFLAVKRRIRDPRYRARVWGIRDYGLGRFGDCPPAVRKLNSCN